jgi:hypothetical protein
VRKLTGGLGAHRCRVRRPRRGDADGGQHRARGRGGRTRRRAPDTTIPNAQLPYGNITIAGGPAPV